MQRAYYLMKTSCSADLEITIYERSTALGGNSATATIDIGGGRQRWVDMGVNDFNARTYFRMMSAMREIGFDDFQQLEDSTCFFTPDGRILHTVDGPSSRSNKAGVPDLAVPNEMARINEDFMRFALNRVRSHAGDDPGCTVADGVAEFAGTLCGRDHRIFSKIVEELLYPRISAMYFTDDRGPARMPLAGIMDYYLLREGVDETPTRMCFRNGASALVESLSQWLRNRGVRIVTDVAVGVCPSLDGVRIVAANRSDITRFDRVVMACHAEDASKILDCDSMCPDVFQFLGAISYSTGVAVAHSDTRLLPPHRGAWRTYNIPIRLGFGIVPYSISYVVNQHQNDRACADSIWRPDTDFFVTLNPPVPISDRFILRHAGTDEPAIRHFRHNVLNRAGLEAQRSLNAWHIQDRRGSAEGRLYFAGGWTNGAGLHEQCFEQAERVASLIARDITRLAAPALQGMTA